jgi:hypothetical protein
MDQQIAGHSGGQAQQQARCPDDPFLDDEEISTNQEGSAH